VAQNIKSADRVLEILEYFSSSYSSGVRIKDICRDLGYPQSSASALLMRLVDLGYLRYDPQARDFHPTPRIGLLGNRYVDSVPSSKHFSECLEQLHSMSGELCFIAQRNGVDLQYIAYRQEQQSQQAVPTPGLTRPLALAATGRAMLASLPTNEVRGILRRNNAESVSSDWVVSETALLEDLQSIRETGYAQSDPQFTPGLIGLATWVSFGENKTPYAIGIAVPVNSECKKRDSSIQALLDIRDTFPSISAN